ncbi:MAG: hypothetical protein WBJ84_01865 [Bacteroidales bacterium]
MVNKWLKGAGKCTPLYVFALALLTLLTENINAQNISKHYISTQLEQGMLYFILPDKQFKNNITDSKLIYDITYKTINDSVTLNFSYYDMAQINIDSIVFAIEGHKFRSPANKLFIATKKQKWHYRYSANFLFEDINTIFNSTTPPEITLTSVQGKRELKTSPGKWKKHSAIVKKIITLIRYNQ